MEANNTPVKIASLELENVKRIRACTLTPSENGLTVIGGRNNQGKTSILDAIAWALGGERYPNDLQQKLEEVQKTYRTGSIISRFLLCGHENGKTYDFYKTFVEILP